MSVNWQGVSDIELASGYQKDPSTAGADNGIANYWCNWYLENTKWEGIFKMAELASTTVDGLRKSTKLSESKTLQGYLGEALVLRSLAYFDWYVAMEMFLIKKVCLILIFRMCIWERLIVTVSILV